MENTKNTLQVLKLETDAKLPVRAHHNDAGADIFSLSDYTLVPNEPVKIRTGIAMAVPDGYVGMICDRSSMGAKGVRVLGGIIDSGYRGEVQVLLINLRQTPLSIQRGDKIAQLLLLPVGLHQVVEAESLDDTARASGGFGSTGV